MKINEVALQNSFIFDEPFDYKGLKIYPVTLKELFIFNSVVDCLLVDKNSIPDPKIISMTYLDYIMSQSNDDNRYIEKVLILLYVCTKNDTEKIKIFETAGKHTIIINDILLSSDDFENIKRIICEQNLVDVPDYSIQKEIRDRIEEGKRIRRKMGGSKMASFEDQIISLSIATGLPLKDIYGMTYRKFSKSLSRTDLFIHYQIYLQSSMSGLVQYKDTSFIKHWLNEINEDKNQDLMDMDAVKNKMNFEDKK